MAGRFANNDAMRNIRRINGEITVDKEDMKDFVNVAKAHASAGNMGDFTTILSALGRLEQQNDVTEAIKVQNAEDRKLLLAEIDSRMNVVDQAKKVASTIETEVVPKWAKELISKVKQLEK